jgi:methylamine---corrinoid protein Co-methyltransferase
MSGLLDFMEKAVQGPMRSSQDFLMKGLIPGVRRAVKEFDICYSPETPVCMDDLLCDRLYAAAISFLADVGIYCEGTNRVVNFDKKDIEKGLRSYKQSGVFGEGKERRRLTPRKPEDTKLPWCHMGNGIVASSEEIATALVKGYGSVPQASSVTIPALASVKGIPIMGGSPLEIYGVIDAIGAARNGLWRAGRPGLPIMNLCSTATTATGTIAGCYPTVGARPSDGWLIDFMAEMTLDFNNLNKLAFVNYMGGNIGATDLTILGGYAGGPAGTALVMTAYQIAGAVFMNADYQLSGTVEMNLGCSSTRQALWVLSTVGRAMSRNTGYSVLANQYAVGGPGTKTYFYEAAAQLLAVVTSGFAGFESCHPARGIVNDGVTPTEPQFNADVACGIAESGMTAGRACELCLQLLEKYEEIIKTPSPELNGMKYPQLYDLASGKRGETYDRLLDDVMAELSGMGIPIF